MRAPKIVVFIAVLLASTAIAQEPSALVTTSVSSYTLRPGDVLLINVWGQESFSGQFQIDENEQFLYPVLGEMSTRNLTVSQIRDTLTAGLETLFNNPFVTVSPRFRVSVLGYVQNPGLYTIDPTLTAIDVVAMAGGPAANGNLKDIRLRRMEATESIDYEEAGTRGRTLREIGIRSGDQIFVPRRAFTRQDLTLLLQFAQLALTVVLLINAL